MMTIIFFTGGDGEWQDILPGRQRAGSEAGECTRRIISFVEIDSSQTAGAGLFDGQKSP